jgi:ribonuclease HI
MGVGLAVKDSLGPLMAALCMTQPYISDPATAEAFAARRGIQLCRELGIRNIILEGDSLEIVTAMRKNEGWA